MPRHDALRGDARQLSQLDRRGIADLAWAAVELAFARLRLHSAHARKLIAMAAGQKSAPPLEPKQDAIAARVAFAIPRAAARLPWRTDCLVQALAGERWLARSDIPSTLFIGIPGEREGEFEAHAWLKAGERVVTGGDIEGFVPFRP